MGKLSFSNLPCTVFSFQIALKISVSIIFFKVTKIAIFPKKKTLILYNRGHGDFALALEPGAYLGGALSHGPPLGPQLCMSTSE